MVVASVLAVISITCVWTHFENSVFASVCPIWISKLIGIFTLKMKNSYSFSFIASAWHFCDRSVTIKKKRIIHWAELSLYGVFCSYCDWKQQRVVNKIVICGQYWACAGPLLQVWDESFATVTSERCRYEVYVFDKSSYSYMNC